MSDVFALRVRDAGNNLICTACGQVSGRRDRKCRRCRASFHAPRERPNRIEAPDHCSLDGAARLAGRITDYWRGKGIEITTKVEPVSVVRETNMNEGRVYAIRSNIGQVAL